MKVRAFKSRLASLATRLVPRALVLLAVGVTLGYALGTGLVVLMLIEGERPVWGFVPPHAYGPELLLYRYRNLDPNAYGSTADFVDIAVTTCGVCLFMTLTASLSGAWLAHLAWRWAIPIRILNTPPRAIARLRTLWRRAVDRSMAAARVPSCAMHIALAGAGLGFSGAWVGLWTASMGYHLRIAAAYGKGTPQTATPPRPIFGTYADAPPVNWGDGVWVFGGTALAAAVLTALPARRRLIRAGTLAERWCEACGYPRPLSNRFSTPKPLSPTDTGSSEHRLRDIALSESGQSASGAEWRCSECGKPAAARAQRDTSRI